MKMTSCDEIIGIDDFDFAKKKNKKNNKIDQSEKSYEMESEIGSDLSDNEITSESSDK